MARSRTARRGARDDARVARLPALARRILRVGTGTCAPLHACAICADAVRLRL